MGLSQRINIEKNSLNIHFTMEILYKLKIIGFVSLLLYRNSGIKITFYYHKVK